MVEVHCSQTMRQAFNMASEWYDKHVKCIKTTKSGSINGFEFTLHNGDTVIFMTFQRYKMWCIGRTYYRGGKWYHSDYEINEVTDNGRIKSR